MDWENAKCAKDQDVDESVVTRVVLPLPLLLFSLVPLWALVWLIRLITGQPSAAALATAELLTTKGAVYNALSMAKEEFATVQALEPSTIDAFKELTGEERKGRLRTYWASEESDAWAPTWIRSQVETTLGLHRIHLPPSLGLSTARSASHSKESGRASQSRMSVRAAFPSQNIVLPPAARWTCVTPKRSENQMEIIIEAQVQEDSSESEDEDEIHDAGLNGAKERRRGGRAMRYHYGKSRATSTHCRIGMPHAFCLNYSERC